MRQSGLVHQNLVDQKVAYAVANPVTFGVDNDKALKQIQHTLNHKWDDKLVDILNIRLNPFDTFITCSS
jgi:predicted negative regulator of RcsB-dependent stress response